MSQLEQPGSNCTDFEGKASHSELVNEQQNSYGYTGYVNNRVLSIQIIYVEIDKVITKAQKALA